MTTIVIPTAARPTGEGEGGGGGGVAVWEDLTAATVTLSATSPTTHYALNPTGTTQSVILPVATAMDGKLLTLKLIKSGAVSVLYAGEGNDIDGNLSRSLTYQNQSVTLVPYSGGWRVV